MQIEGRRTQSESEFESYCKEILPRIIGLAINVTGDRSDAEDVAIETLAKTFLRWPRLSRAEWRDGWVLRVAANHSIDVLRKRQRSNLANLEVPTSQATADTSPDVAEAIGSLPRRQQEVLVLRFYGDMSYAEIAQRLHISQGSVKTHLHRGLASIRTGFGLDEKQGEAYREQSS